MNPNISSSLPKWIWKVYMNDEIFVVLEDKFKAIRFIDALRRGYDRRNKYSKKELDLPPGWHILQDKIKIRIYQPSAGRFKYYARRIHTPVHGGTPPYLAWEVYKDGIIQEVIWKANKKYALRRLIELVEEDEIKYPSLMKTWKGIY